jgi:hypothetical protein
MTPGNLYALRKMKKIPPASRLRNRRPRAGTTTLKMSDERPNPGFEISLPIRREQPPADLKTLGDWHRWIEQENERIVREGKEMAFSYFIALQTMQQNGSVQ